MSSLAGAEYDRLIPHGVHGRANAVDLSLKALSIRTRHFKTSVLSRLKALAADANEALEVALEIGKLVCRESLLNSDSGGCGSSTPINTELASFGAWYRSSVEVGSVN